MLRNVNLDHVLFLDIETVPQYQNFGEVPDRMQHLWEKKSASLKRQDEREADELYERAGIYAEFGKIVCISVGYIAGAKRTLRLKSYASHNEEELLKEFAELLIDHADRFRILCGHNGKEFDFPYIARRMMVLGLELPPVLQMHGKKPWEIPHLDTMELWKLGDYKSFTSLDLLAAIFDIPTPKDDIDGSMVRQVYYEDNDLQRIVSYCEKDVATLVNVFLKMGNMPLISEEQMEFGT